MLQKLKILDDAFDKLGEINEKNFLFEKFKEVNSEIETTLVDLKSNEFNLQDDKSVKDYNNIIKDLLNKIERLETKILPKANLLEEFSKSKY